MPLLPPGRLRPVAARVTCVTAALLAACAPADRALAPAASPRFAPGPNGTATGVVISQIYGGGGGTGASTPYKADYVELYNAGPDTATITGWSVQYASATGTGNFSAGTAVSGRLAPGAYYLVGMTGSQGSVGADLPVTPDATGSLALSATAGKVVLVTQVASLGCNGGSTPCTAEQRAKIVDLVGYGNANYFEGAAAAPTLSTTTAGFRKSAGAVDTDNNGADFATGTPNPRSSSSGGGSGTVAVAVSASPATFEVGGQSTLTATVTRSGSAVTPTAIVWSVNPAGRVTFSDQSGNTVTATGATTGTATVTATATVDGTNYTGSTTVTVNAAATSLAVTGYSFRGNDPLPVGFSELYRAAPAGSTNYIRSGITWSTTDASVITVDTLGNVTAVGNGTASVVATEASTGRTGNASVAVTTFAFSDTSVYADELQFGRPTDATPADEFLVNRATFAASWNATRGQPNWVAYNLDASHKVAGGDRCDCFTPDPLLPSGFPRVTTADYDGSGYSRGHMTMSADRTHGAADNAQTFYYTNIIPQTNANNAGPWLGLEQFLGDLAVQQNKEVFIVAGGAAYSGTLNNAGRVAVPTLTWKVAVILDRDRGFGDVRSASDVRVIAVVMPNTTTIPQRTADWPLYQVSVDSVEALTGYDVLSALPDGLEAQLETQVTSGPRAVGLEVAPERVSLSTTSLVTAVLLSGTDFDATTFAPADLRLVTQNGTQVAPSSRGGVVSTSTRDVNGDGRLDRAVSFSTAALRAAGLSADAPALTMRLVGAGAPAWLAADATPPVVGP